MGRPKWDTGVAIVKATDASNEPTSTTFRYPVCESANIEGSPINYERVLGFIPDRDQIVPAGFDYSFAINGITPNVNILGNLLWHAFGTDTWGTYHTITPGDSLPYSNVLIDRGLDLGTTTPTERLIGSKVSNFTLEAKVREFFKASASGAGCTLGTKAAALAPSVPTGANDGPLKWESLNAAGGHFKIGMNGAATAQDSAITGFKIESSRPTIPSGITLAGNQPTAMDSGIREIHFEITKEFFGADAKANYLAWASQHEFAMEFKALVGTYYVTLSPLYGFPVSTFASEIGAGEDILSATIRCKAYKKGSGDLITFLVSDATTAAYT